MLNLSNIRKEYRTGSFVQHALDGVSLNLRDSEFVAILGPSGSGKTTLLNIIGGLDRYDSGDLVINGISTRKYRDRDWDAYRNHTVGFVFQSYNLIPHQTILSNVELALTISGIPKEERRRRAAEALEKVGLGEQLHKKPNQLSGGQMQRVAIARALVNDPDILLADEPTGALDSDTSVQVMDLLREVARDRLVVMVTHNPELAERYATRIVNLRDGRIISDSNPLPDQHAGSEHRAFGRASMSFLTALGLSFNNLLTKKARTLLVAFAGSIGIIGIAMILSLSNGVNGYINGIEEETLSQYPFQIEKTNIDFSSMMPMAGNRSSEEAKRETGSAGNQSGKSGRVQEYQTVTQTFSRMNSNDLKSLKLYLDRDSATLKKYAKSVEYHYNITPRIYRKTGAKTYRQVNPDITFSSLGTDSLSSIGGFSGSDSFFVLPKDRALYSRQYTVKAGRWPRKYNEIVVVLSSGDRISDMTLYTLGLKNPEELEQAAKNFSAGKKVRFRTKLSRYDYRDLMHTRFKLVNNADLYRYNADYRTWTDMSRDTAFTSRLAAKGETLRIVGVVSPKKNSDITMLRTGLGFPTSLRSHIIADASASEVVRQQRAQPAKNVLTGKAFTSKENGADLKKLFHLDPQKLSQAFRFNPSALQSALAPGSLPDPASGQNPLKAGTLPGFSNKDMQKLLKQAGSGLTQENMETLFRDLAAGYGKSGGPGLDALSQGYSAYLRSEEVQQILREAMEKKLDQIAASGVSQDDVQSLVNDVMKGFSSYVEQNHLTDVTKAGEYVAQYLQTPAARQALTNGLKKILAKSRPAVSSDEIRQVTAAIAAGYGPYAEKHHLTTPETILGGFTKYLQSRDGQKRLTAGLSKMIDTKKISASLGSQLTKAIGQQMTGYMSRYASRLSSALAGSMKFDASAFAGAMKTNLSEEQLQSMLTSMMSPETASYEENLRSMGYADEDDPAEIVIYPKNFAAKTSITKLIDRYNDRVRAAGQKDRVIAYNDIVGTMMSSVTKIVNAISYVLIAFVSISLIVSSIMIGVITYISVLERRKEIGILRAIGASKRNVSSVFNAETFIIGALAGLMGVAITGLLLIPVNLIIGRVTSGASIHASLPPLAALVLILLSTGLTLLGGLIPARKASKSDPVTALRTE